MDGKKNNEIASVENLMSNSQVILFRFRVQEESYGDNSFFQSFLLFFLPIIRSNPETCSHEYISFVIEERKIF